MDDLLSEYHRRRDFSATPEPKGIIAARGGRLFVVQKHAATRLHFDFRLELDGVLKSWAVTRGPSLNPQDKRLAVRTEDHPLEYGDFEGIIPSGYGKGAVLLWDQGQWAPHKDPHQGLKNGALKFSLKGSRLRGDFALVRMKPRPGEKRENWLLIKERDQYAETFDVTQEWIASVKTGRDLQAIARTGEAWTGVKKAQRARNPGKSTPPSLKVRFTPPQLACLRQAPPRGDEWLHEVKHDGYRIQALVQDARARLITRNERDWTDKYPSVARALTGLEVRDAVLDGELVVLDKNGRCDFGALQNAAGEARLAYFAFDLLRLNGKSLTAEPLIQRKALLKPLIENAGEPLRFSDHIIGQGEHVFQKACQMGLEGVVSKKADAPYRSGRTLSWIKSKCAGNDEFVIGGYRVSDKRGRPFASLLLGEHVDGALVYRGRVGAGFDAALFGDLAKRFRALRRKTSPFSKTPSDARRGAVWLAPRLVAQIAYAEQTSEGRLRHPRFLGLRADKAAEEVGAQIEAAPMSVDRSTIAGVKLTHPDRVMYPKQGATKADIALYFEAHAEALLAHVKDRPLSLVRCPGGQGEECFFQKHHTASAPDFIDQVRIQESGGESAPYLMIRNVQGLVAAAQIGTLELHIWGSRTDAIERPDRLVFDLDPDAALSFADVREAARDIRDILQSLGLVSFPLLTGGKGVHVIAPIARRHAWPAVQAFAKGLAGKIAAADPSRYVATMSKAQRKGKIFIDWLRNQRGATAIAPYSLRARAGAPIAAPVSWAELARTESAAAYTLDTIGARLSGLKTAPWEGYFSLRQSLTKKALKAFS